jgi:hypothetical protein
MARMTGWVDFKMIEKTILRKGLNNRDKIAG